LPRYREACTTLGAAVSVETPAGRVEGRASGIGEDGALVVDAQDGSTVHVTGGDVVRLRSAAPS
jgi:biotin-(acetyl-CoA carboxylase) ligase